MPTVSVILPVRNAADTIDGAVAGIAEQTLEDWELIAVNDGSSDESGGLLDAWAARDRRIHVLHRPPQGIAAALNAGLAVARAPLIARMDADDLSLPDRLLLQHGFLKKHPDIGAAGCRVVYGGDARANAGYAAHVDWVNSLLTPEDHDLNRFVEAPLAHPSAMFRRELVSRYGGYRDGDFPEDYELWLRWMEAGVRFAKIPESLLVWRDPPSRLSRADPRYAPEAFFRVKAVYLARWLARHNPFHPAIRVVGGGRVTRRRVEHLARAGARVEGYYDIDPRKAGLRYGAAVVEPLEALPPPGRQFVVSYIGKRESRGAVAEWLTRAGYRIGRDWITAA